MVDFAAVGASYRDVSKCAIVLEGDPAGQDKRLDFESFPGEVQEDYATNAYKEHGAYKTPQPSGATYTGGNWGTFNLNLVFRADEVTRRLTPGGQTANLTTAQVEGVLLEMERKVRWLQALAFPLERKASALTNRILQRARTAGIRPLREQSRALSQLTRSDPPFILIVFGSFLVIRGYVTNVSLRWMGPWQPVTIRPFGAEVSLTIQRLETGFLTFERIRNQAGKSRQTPNFQEVSGEVRVGAREQAQRQDRRGNVAASGGRPGNDIFGNSSGPGVDPFASASNPFSGL